jgi:hypothetical protein
MSEIPSDLLTSNPDYGIFTISEKERKIKFRRGMGVR